MLLLFMKTFVVVSKWNLWSRVCVFFCFFAAAAASFNELSISRHHHYHTRVNCGHAYACGSICCFAFRLKLEHKLTARESNCVRVRRHFCKRFVLVIGVDLLRRRSMSSGAMSTAVCIDGTSGNCSKSSQFEWTHAIAATAERRCVPWYRRV